MHSIHKANKRKNAYATVERKGVIASQELGALFYQVAAGNSFASGIARSLGKKPSTITRQLRGLEAHGFVKQAPRAGLAVNFEPNWPRVMWLPRAMLVTLWRLKTTEEKNLLAEPEKNAPSMDAWFNRLKELGKEKIQFADAPEFERFVKLLYVRHAEGRVRLRPDFPALSILESFNAVADEFLNQLVKLPPEKLAKHPHLQLWQKIVADSTNATTLLEEALEVAPK